MGIGNDHGCARDPVVTGRSHYPSWGLETDGPVRPAPHDLVLITPHGDWKPQCFANGTAAHSSSLPLMGIGNSIGRNRYIVARGVLITPHGDWKLGCDTRAMTRSCRTHYPSWGLETHRQSSPSGSQSVHSLPLMGIGNDAGPSPDTSRMQAHYPSWGLETSHPSAIARCTSSSLPLMGIGNSVVRRRRDRPDDLITPHGDWKLRGSTAKRQT